MYDVILFGEENGDMGNGLVLIWSFWVEIKDGFGILRRSKALFGEENGDLGL